VKELDPSVFVAVFEEMLGPWLWVLVAVAAIATAIAIFIVLRDGGLRPRRLLWSQLAAIAGGVAAILFMQAITHSSFSDVGGPVDWVLGLAIFAGGAIATLIGGYAVLGVLGWLG
jgi:hypothetical protein